MNEDLIEWLKGQKYLIDENSTTMSEVFENKHKWNLATNNMINKTLVKIKELESIKKKDTVAFCMRCFANSSVPEEKDINFCHYCGSEGTCIPIKKDEAEYLRNTIETAITMSKV